MVRDQQIFWPWYRRGPDPACRIDLTEDFSARGLHNQVVEILKCAKTYHLTIQAAFRYPVGRPLPKIKARTLVCSEPGEPLHRFAKKAAGLIPEAKALNLDRSLASKRRAMIAFVDAA